MAGAENSGSEVQRAVNMLREAASLIDSSLNRTRENNTPVASTETLIPSTGSNMAQTNSTTPTTSTRDEAVLRNFHNLFAGHGSQEQRPSSSRIQKASHPPAKRAKRQSFFVPKETWTHEFFCLAETETDRIPNRQEKFTLQSAGLGRKKLVFGSKDTAKLVQEKLENAFPKLSHGGGFEILRSGATVRELVVIRPPLNVGYSVSFLRNESGLGQALAYVRPVQRSLDISVMDSNPQVLNILYMHVL